MLLSEAITEFLDHRQAEGYRANTLKSNRQKLYRIYDIVGDIELDSFDATTYDKVQAIESRRGLSANTLNLFHDVMSVFIKWAHARGHMDTRVNPLAARRRRKDPPKEKLMMGPTQFAALLNAAESHDPRDRALIALAIYTMARQSELITLRVKDLNLDTGSLYVRVHKTAQDDIMPVSAELDAEMRKWLTHYTQEVGALDPNFLLIPARHSTGWNKRTYSPTSPISSTVPIVQRAFKDIGIPRTRYQDGMHMIRRSSARALYNELVSRGYDGAMRQVQTWLHHSSIATTEKYLGISVDRNTRDREIRGLNMFPSMQDVDNVIQLKGSAHG